MGDGVSSASTHPMMQPPTMAHTTTTAVYGTALSGGQRMSTGRPV